MRNLLLPGPVRVAMAAFALCQALNAQAEPAGSGFIVTRTGLVVTTYRVIEGATKLEILTPAGLRTADVSILARDAVNDLAVLRIQGIEAELAATGEPPFSLFSGVLNGGDACLVVGYPHRSAVGSAPQSSGCIVGRDDEPYDARVFRIFNTSQPVTPGSPLLSANGDVFGVLVSGSSEREDPTLASGGPQTLVGLRAGYLRALLETLGETSLSKRPNLLEGLQPDQQAALIAPFVVRILAIRGTEAGQEPEGPFVFKVKRWKGGLGELAVSHQGLRYREVNAPMNDFAATCTDIRRIDLKDSRGWRPMVFLELRHRFSEGIESRSKLSRDRQRLELTRIREAIADSCGILIRE